MGTHPIFESDFDCLTVSRLKLDSMANSVSTKKIVRKRNKRFIRHQSDRFDRVDASRDNASCHPLDMVPRHPTNIVAKTKRTSKDLLLTMLPSLIFSSQTRMPVSEAKTMNNLILL